MEENKIEEQDSNITENEVNINSDADISGSSHLNEPVEEGNEVDILKAEIEALKDKYLRQAAEFDNFRRRTSKEKMELVQTAGKEVIIDLLEVLDDCERAQEQFDKNVTEVDSLKEGVYLIFNKLRNKLTSKGLKQMETIGTVFNPDQQEAITEVPAPKDKLKGKVIDEVEKGYYLNDKIIRFAKVVIGK